MFLSKLNRIFRNQNGLTLLELMIAIFILALIAMGLFQAFTAAFQTMNDAKERTIATNYAQQILEDFKNRDFKKIETIPFGPIEGTKYFHYAIVEKNNEDLKKVTVQISWIGMKNSEKKVFLDTVINNEQTIAEVGAVPAGIIIYAHPYNLLPGNDPQNRDIPSHIWAEVVDKNGNLITDWNDKEVDFDIESYTDLENNSLDKYYLGYLRNSSSPIKQGVADTYFDQYPSEEREGYITIKASLTIDGVEIYDTLTLRITNKAVSVILSSDKEVIRTEGGEEGENIAHLTAKIVDPAGDIVETDREITFDISSGPETSNLINFVPNGGDGLAEIDLKAGSIPGINAVVATAILLEPGIVNIEVVDPGAHTISIKAINTMIVQQGTTEIIATLKDYLGNPVGNENIYFEITSFEPDNPDNNLNLGYLSNGAPTTGISGEANTWLTMNYGGKATVKAEWDGGDGDTISATVQVACRNHTLFVIAEPLTVQEGGTATITAELTDAFGEPLPGETINFSIENGNAFLSSISGITDSEGVTSVALTMLANVDGTYVIVEGKWTGDLTGVLDDVEIECTSAPIYKVELTANKTTISENESLDITATVTESNSPVNNILVTFEMDGSSGAKLDNQSPPVSKNTDENGKVTITLSGLNSGESVTITAEAEDAEDSITISCEAPEIKISLITDPSGPYFGSQGKTKVYFYLKVENNNIDLKEMIVTWSGSTNDKLLTDLYISTLSPAVDELVYSNSSGAQNGTRISFNQKTPYTLLKDASYRIAMIFKSNVNNKNWTITFINPETQVEIQPPITFYLKN